MAECIGKIITYLSSVCVCVWVGGWLGMCLILHISESTRTEDFWHVLACLSRENITCLYPDLNARRI